MDATSVSPGLGVAELFLPLAFGVAFYVFWCYCAMLICKKAGSDPGALIWIPILQVIPMFNAAGMNLLWILGLFVPILNIVVGVMLWMKLCEARGKAAWLGILMLVPVANLVLFLYLAFSE